MEDNNKQPATNRGAIDIHHHYVPPLLLREAKTHGSALGVELHEVGSGENAISFAGGPRNALHPALPELNQRFEMMKNGQIAMAAVEAYTGILGYQLDPQKGESWCRLYNEGMRDLVREHPDRFVALAAVPMQDPGRAATVLEHAIVELKLCGVMIGSNVNGRYYNSDEFDPFWRKAEELDVLVIMHPEDVAGTERMQPYGLRLICGNPADTTLSIGYLTYSGVFDRFPRLNLCVFHGGGFFPYHLGRFDQGFKVRSRSGVVQALSPPSAYLTNLYFDTMLYRVDMIENLRQLVGSSHMMIGTDYPFTLGDWMAVEKIQALNCPDSEKVDILERNAVRLLKL